MAGFYSAVDTDGNVLLFFARPVAGVLGALTVMVWLYPVLAGAWRAARRGRGAQVMR